MNRRKLFKMFGAAGLLSATRPTSAAQADPAAQANDLDIDPYFLDPGELGDDESAHIQEFAGYQEQLMNGQNAVMPRSGRPKRAPNFALLHWNAPLGDVSGRLVGPLSVSPPFAPGDKYRLNAQILGFHPQKSDWRRTQRATLTCELRTHDYGEPTTWLFAQQFEVVDGTSLLTPEYIVQRRDSPAPIATDSPTIDLRIQLMREKGLARLLSKIMRIWSLVVSIAGLGTGMGLFPPVRIPQQLREGVAFSQAVLGGVDKEEPVWRSAFTPYALSPGTSRFALTPGLWIVVDESLLNRADGTNGMMLQDRGNRIVLTRNGQLVDANYLVLDIEVTAVADRGFQDIQPRTAFPPVSETQ